MKSMSIAREARNLGVWSVKNATKGPGGIWMLGIAALFRDRPSDSGCSGCPDRSVCWEMETGHSEIDSRSQE